MTWETFELNGIMYCVVLHCHRCFRITADTGSSFCPYCGEERETQLEDWTPHEIRYETATWN